MQEDQQQDQSQPGWVFKPGGENSQPVPAAPMEDSPALPQQSAQVPQSSDPAMVTWSASEFIANPKSSGWFMLLGLATILVVAVVYLVTHHDLVSVTVIVILGIIVGVFAARQPRSLTYVLDKAGIHIGLRYYPYTTFKSFSIVQEDAFSHVSLLPLKRFLPPLAIHYPPEDEDKIINTLADYLPYEEHKPDMIDNFSKRVRF